MITLQDYWMGRDEEYPLAMTPQIERNAQRTVDLANQLLLRYGGHAKVNSGWRPPQVNAATPGAAKFSRHMTGEAVDLADPEGMLDDWCMENLPVLEKLGLWMEHPAATKGWCHLQTIPPKSGRRVFYP